PVTSETSRPGRRAPAVPGAGRERRSERGSSSAYGLLTGPAVQIDPSHRRSLRKTGRDDRTVYEANSVLRGGQAPRIERPGPSALRRTPRSADRARSLARVSQKREYFQRGLETIGDFALRLCKLGVQIQTANLQKAAISG